MTGAKNYTVYVYVQMLQWYLPPTLPTFYFRLTRHYPHWRVRVLNGLGYRDPDPYPVYPDPEPVRVVYTLDNHYLPAHHNFDDVILPYIDVCLIT